MDASERKEGSTSGCRRTVVTVDVTELMENGCR
jgi:hypothetical protein